jgi:hypothetical protein
MMSYLDFRPYLKSMYDRPPPTAKHTIAIITVVIIVINLYINKKRTIYLLRTLLLTV